MGHSTIPTEPGEDCLCCWPPGDTPKAAYISFEGITDCGWDIPAVPAPMNASVEVIQSEFDPCFWTSSVAHWTFSWDPCMGDMNGCYQDWQIEKMFKGWQEGNCNTHFYNTLSCGPAHIYGGGGAAAVVFNMGHLDASLGSLMHSINMEPAEETKFDFWPASEERICIRLARKKDATNILILVEPENL